MKRIALLLLMSLPIVVAAQGPHAPAASPYIDVHTHIEIGMADEALAQAADAMQGDNRAKVLFMPSPFDDAGHGAFDIELLQTAAKKYGGRIAVMGGGGTLNPMIVEAVRAGKTTP